MRVSHHEVNNSIQVLYQRMPQALREVPKETLGIEAIRLGFKNIKDGLRLLEQSTNWPRFLTGKYSIYPKKVPPEVSGGHIIDLVMINLQRVSMIEE